MMIYINSTLNFVLFTCTSKEKGRVFRSPLTKSHEKRHFKLFESNGYNFHYHGQQGERKRKGVRKEKDNFLEANTILLN